MPPVLSASPARLLDHWLGADGLSPALAEYERWFHQRGLAISAALDRAGTPGLCMYDRFGQREDRVLYPPEYRDLLDRGYGLGVVARASDERTLMPGYRIGYVTAFFDAGLYCPYTVSLGTLVAVLKYASPALRDRTLPQLAGREKGFWQGATWITEAGGGSDIGAHVRTRAERVADGWRLTGDKYFASNVGAEVAVVAARPAGGSDGVRGLALFLVPRRRADGSLNYRIRRLKDKIATRSVPTGEVELQDAEASLLGEPGQGIYLIMEVLNVSRVANSVASVALMQRAIAEARAFAERRVAFGRPLLEQPLLDRQMRERQNSLRACFGLAWESARQLDRVWQERPPYSERHRMFRLIAHLAKYWTAEQAIRTAQWAMEVHGGAGVLADYGIERLLREAMILAIWEGSPHRQMLDGLELMARHRAHEGLFTQLGHPPGTDRLRATIEHLLNRDQAEREAGVEPVFRELAAWTAEALAPPPA
ncbi:Acyl-CoA dehydrogenase [Thioalkalivibrio nitratireducens DSM 14787]|uniref:Acyl-CoA dehydrogenase n=1 Tax=Thioalkalivibrio nitratireducens (strain DSM 14787 / UNIQEM 213 / ALEN2) TaxID=1255043 RepID=L0E081_THIND|nr:acyl-CoA dehydrogenase family protein [Thioalkalivibrio nitratireducens]AGA34703.1 Acyl-CoA dehydrogenase [Thioalkalivibrio nitratireducens DSM 14787]